MTAIPPDFGKRIGMSLIAGRSDLEIAAATVRDLGFEGTEVHIQQLGPGLAGVPVFEAHAAAAGRLLGRTGLTVSALNAVGDPSFDPYSGPAALAGSIEGLASHLRLAAALGAPRVLIWEGRVSDPAYVHAACAALTHVIAEAKRRSSLAAPPEISCELHPFTFALKHRALGQLAAALRSVGAGICLDFCHFGVALGADFIAEIDSETLATINHVHFADTDARTSELHFPPGAGVLDLDRIGRALGGRPIAVSWDLFGWPEPRHAARSAMARYADFVRRHAASAGP